LQAIKKTKSGKIKFPNFVPPAIRKIEVGPSSPIIAIAAISFPNMYVGKNNPGAIIIATTVIKSKMDIDFLNT